MPGGCLMALSSDDHTYTCTLFRPHENPLFFQRCGHGASGTQRVCGGSRAGPWLWQGAHRGPAEVGLQDGFSTALPSGNVQVIHNPHTWQWANSESEPQWNRRGPGGRAGAGLAQGSLSPSARAEPKPRGQRAGTCQRGRRPAQTLIPGHTARAREPCHGRGVAESVRGSVGAGSPRPTSAFAVLRVHAPGTPAPARAALAAVRRQRAAATRRRVPSAGRGSTRRP